MALTIVLFVGMVVTRLLLLKRQGIAALKFGDAHKTDFLIPPFALFYFYFVFAAAFGLRTLSTKEIFHSGISEWLGVAFCFTGLSFLLWSLISFGKSFRVGIDTSRPGKLVTDGIFAYSRNPIYVRFAFVLIGQFLVFSNWILLTYELAGFWLFHRQVLHEEEYLRKHYGDDYTQLHSVLPPSTKIPIGQTQVRSSFWLRLPAAWPARSSASQQRHETLPNVLLLRCLPNERYQATPHRVPVLRVTGQFLNEQFLLIEDSPHQCRHHQEKYQEVPPRPERETHADEQEKASHVHGMAHQPV